MPIKLIHYFHRRYRQSRLLTHSGFTLLELLVAILIGGIITSGLLFLVIEMLQVNNREERLTQTQQDMRRALDYIASDVGEAVFVYSTLTFSDPTAVPPIDFDLISQLDDAPQDATPVLAFWRLDPLSDDQIDDLNDFCDNQPQNARDECEALLVRQNTYTLVVYFHQVNDDDDIWEGQSRIIRYELPAYDTISNNVLERNSGYADPAGPIPGGNGNDLNSFITWEKAANETTDGTEAVLTDFVNVVDDGEESLDCPVLDSSAEPLARFVRIPDIDGANSFYTCVAQPDMDAGNSENLNKSLIIYLQGNTAQKNANPNQILGVSADSSLPALESQVLIRGVIQNAP